MQVNLSATKNNYEIKAMLKLYGITCGELAGRLRCHRQTIYNYLCYPLNEDRYELYKVTIQQIASEKKVGGVCGKE